MTDDNSHTDQAPEPKTDNLTKPAHGTTAPRRSRTWLIAGGSALAAVLLAGGGIAVGAALADEMDDDDDRTSSDDASTPATVRSVDIGTESAAELTDIIDAASAEAAGAAVGIEADRDGSWEVSFETSAGEETKVRVSANGTAEVVSTDAPSADDNAPRGVLDADTVDALVAAAMAEVAGKIIDIEIDDDTASPFDISVVQADGRTVDLELDADMKVLSANPS